MLILAGPGRSGTTALTQLLQALGLSLGEASGIEGTFARAGLESTLPRNRGADVVKNPHLSFDLREKLEANPWLVPEISAVIAPIRKLDEIVSSRVRVALSAGQLRARGGMWRTRTPRGLRLVSAESLYEVAYTCAEFDLELRVLAYPRFTNDCSYCFSAIGDLVPDVDEATFIDVWKETMKEPRENTNALSLREHAGLAGLIVKDSWAVLRRKAPLRLR
jgi:hypothetical protein